jgi:peptidoglycan/LPS O-acetylase OafA/YrhL
VLTVTLPDSSSSGPAPRVQPARTFLVEVQALRAAAVLLVVGYHFWPNRLHGGFVGVDVFFVISGFLITSHLHREVQTRGRIRLAQFYARRARRLLPAAILVLLVSAGATLVFLPPPRWASAAGEVLASALYVQNWLLSGRAVDYSASQDAASTVQHFWSLSVEEQFYLVWPGLILLLLVVARRMTRVSRDQLLLAGILLVSAASLAWSVHATATDQAAAYFTTTTRIWELGAGASLALWSRIRASRAPGGPATPAALSLVLRWAGFAAIAAAALLLTADSPFPGYLALLPTLGTVAVIGAGEPGRRDPAGLLVRQRPVQFLGDVSYSLYLWHWPAIVLLPFALDRALTARDKLLLLALCIGLAWLTKTVVEDPARQWRRLARPAVTALATVGAMLVVAATSVGIQHRADVAGEAALARITAAESDPCFGAGALGGPGSSRCSDPFRLPDSLTIPDGDTPWFNEPACVASQGPLQMATCRFGSGPPTRTVALVGDSHAQHWRGAVEVIARQLGWEVVEIFRGGCTVTHARTYVFDGEVFDRARVDDCRGWTDQVEAELARTHPDQVFTSGFVSAMQFDRDPARSVETGAEGFADAWTHWADAGMRVTVLHDIPPTGGVNMIDCLSMHAQDPVACSRPRAEIEGPDALTRGVELASSDRIGMVDLTDHFCDEQRCYAAVGGAIVYHDFNHMTAQFSRSLAPFLLESIGGGLD